jgi:Putative adhesin
MRRALGIAGLVVAGACVMSGCSHLLPPQSMSETKTLDQSVTSIKLAGRSGDVVVRGQSGLTKVTVKRTIKYRDGTPKQDTYRVDGGVLVLGDDCGGNCDVDYDITAPAGLPVSGETSNGDVQLRNVGAVNVTTSSGEVDLADVAGTVKAETSNGEITARGLRGGSVQAKTSNGRIDLALLEPGDVTARTDNGDIKLAVPTGGYRVTTQNHNGHRKIGVTDDPNGKNTLDLGSDNGDIEVVAA